MRILSTETIGISVAGQSGDVHIEGGIDEIEDKGLTVGVKVENILTTVCISRACESVLFVVIGV
jgi:hypothetical protein